MDVTGLKDGNVAGFGIFEIPYTYVAVQQNGGKRKVTMYNDDKRVETAVEDLQQQKLWIRVRTTDKNFTARFYYSLNGVDFAPIGNTLQMGWGYREWPIGLPCSTLSLWHRGQVVLRTSTGSSSMENEPFTRHRGGMPRGARERSPSSPEKFA